MKTIGTIAIALIGISIAASPALAGKKKSKKKAQASAEKAEAPRRLSDTIGMGIKVAAPTGAVKKAPTLIEENTAVARAESFELGRMERHADAPSGDDAMRLKLQLLTEQDAGQVVRGNTDDIDYCWSRVPARLRDTLATSLKFTVDPRGTVLQVEVGGDTPAKFSTCIRLAAKKWRFPIADGESVVEYPIVLNAP